VEEGQRPWPLERAEHGGDAGARAACRLQRAQQLGAVIGARRDGQAAEDLAIEEEHAGGGVVVVAIVGVSGGEGGGGGRRRDVRRSRGRVAAQLKQRSGKAERRAARRAHARRADAVRPARRQGGQEVGQRRHGGAALAGRFDDECDAAHASGSGCPHLRPASARRAGTCKGGAGRCAVLLSLSGRSSHGLPPPETRN